MTYNLDDANSESSPTPKKIKPEDVHTFIKAAERTKDYWLAISKEAWSEIKHCGAGDQALINRTILPLQSLRAYPAWWSITNIRLPLILSRLGVPVGRDTTQDAHDAVGSTAAICLERLAINLAKTFPMMDNYLRCCKDFCVTDAAFIRAYYEAEDVKEEIKTRLTPQQDANGNVSFTDDKGEVIDPSQEILEDDEGFFLETENVIDVINERVCLRHVLPSRVFVDSSILMWQDCGKLAFEEHYSRQRFIEIFGKKAIDTLPPDNAEQGTKDNPKDTTVKVLEYWDKYIKDCYWIVRDGSDFIEPKGYKPNDNEEKTNGIYNLQGFFPTVKPLMINQATDEFWPIPEYIQIRGILTDIHLIFGKMVDGTKAIIAKLLYDDSIEGLQDALTSDRQALCVGVTNLARSLQQSGGTLQAAVQYIPIDGLITSLDALSNRLESQLNQLYKLIGVSDLLQGLVTDPTQRTFGERQMTEKYALNQIEPRQRGMQEFVRDGYQLICEIALKNFKNESLDKYMLPKTLTPEQQKQYPSARELLKSNTSRFQIELETDSTIAINEEFDKQIRTETVNVITASLEKTANIAQTAPELLAVELHCLKYLVQGLRQGKMFQGEITQAIDAVIAKTQQPQPPQFDKDQATLQFKAQELAAKQQMAGGDSQLEQFKIQTQAQTEANKIQAQLQLKNMEGQIEQMRNQMQMMLAQIKAQSDQATESSKLQLESYKIDSEREFRSADAQIAYEKLQADVALAQQNLLIAQNELRQKQMALEMEAQATMTELQQQQIDSAVSAKTSEEDHQINMIEQNRENQKMVLDEREKYATEARLQAEETRIAEEHHLNKALMRKELLSKPEKSKK